MHSASRPTARSIRLLTAVSGETVRVGSSMALTAGASAALAPLKVTECDDTAARPV